MMRNISKFKSEFRQLLGRVSPREVLSLIGGGISGALVWILIDLNREEMAETGQWLPAQNGVALLAITLVIFSLLVIVPIALIYHKTKNNGADERDNNIYGQTAANGFYILQGLIFLSLFWYVLHGDGLLLFNSVIMGLLASTAMFFLILAIRYRMISAPLIPKDNE